MSNLKERQGMLKFAGKSQQRLIFVLAKESANFASSAMHI